MTRLSALIMSAVLMAASIGVTAQNENIRGNTNKNLADNVPDTWRKEVFTFPLEFAPSIDHKGVEDAYFSPGMFSPEKDDYFNYSFIWQIEGAGYIDAASLEAQLSAYYQGLYTAVSNGKPSPGFVFPRAEPGQKAPDSGQKAEDDSNLVFHGAWLDPFNNDKPLELTIEVEQQVCPRFGTLVVLFRIWEKDHTGALDTLKAISPPAC